VLDRPHGVMLDRPRIASPHGQATLNGSSDMGGLPDE